jgi:hypothetical protein
MCANRIWRGTGFEIFLLPGRVRARPAPVNANCWAAVRSFDAEAVAILLT